MAANKTALPKPRFLTIGYQHYEGRHGDGECRYKSRRVPFLRLSGDWLHAAGFSIGQKARIQVIDQCIMIVVED